MQHPELARFKPMSLYLLARLLGRIDSIGMSWVAI